MIRFALLLLMSLALSSQAIAAVKWNNSNSSKATSSEDSNIKKIRKMGYGNEWYNLEAYAEDIVRRIGDKNNELEIYDGYLFQIPNITNYQISDATLEYYYLISDMHRKTNKHEHYIIQPSDKPLEFRFNQETNQVIEKQFREKAIFNYLYYEDGKIIYDALLPSGRFNHTFTEASYFASNSVGKSITSYLLGHAICEGYITSIDEKIAGWPLMKNTLYYGQPLINLLNMKAGDTHVIESKSAFFTKTGRRYSDGALLKAVRTEGELKATIPIKNAKFAYSNLTSEILFNFIMHRVGKDFDKFISNFYRNKVKVKYPIYQWMSKLTPRDKPRSTKNRIAQGAGRTGIEATRYDFLRIAVSMLNDWKNNSCEGKYLKEIYNRAVPTETKVTWNGRYSNPQRRPSFGNVAKSYAGQFYINIPELKDQVIFAMLGAYGQEIVINMDKSRIVVINAGQENFYHTRKLAFEPLKYGRIRSGNWN